MLYCLLYKKESFWHKYFSNMSWHGVSSVLCYVSKCNSTHFCRVFFVKLVFFIKIRLWWSLVWKLKWFFWYINRQSLFLIYFLKNAFKFVFWKCTSARCCSLLKITQINVRLFFIKYIRSWKNLFEKVRLILKFYHWKENFIFTAG